MDPLQKQVVALSHKVDALYQMIEQLSQKVSEAISTDSPVAVQAASSSFGGSQGRYSYKSYSSFNPAMEHKDVLLDTDCLDAHSQSSEKDLSPEIQINRLTAQLTAAYNRIAALEEQLLRDRIHS